MTPTSEFPHPLSGFTSKYLSKLSYWLVSLVSKPKMDAAALVRKRLFSALDDMPVTLDTALHTSVPKLCVWDQVALLLNPNLMHRLCYQNRRTGQKTHISRLSGQHRNILLGVRMRVQRVEGLFLPYSENIPSWLSPQLSEFLESKDKPLVIISVRHLPSVAVTKLWIVRRCHLTSFI